MTTYDVLKNGLISDGPFNCAERVLMAGNEAYALGLSKDSIKLSAGFGGGMGVEGVCGAISGAVMVLSVMFVRDYAHESQRIKSLSCELIERVRNELSSSDCKELKPLHRTENEKCAHIIYVTARILDDIIERERANAVCGV